MLYQLSYIGPQPAFSHQPSAFSKSQTLERETGIEPATNSLEGCDSTTELLPLKPAVGPQPSDLSKTALPNYCLISSISGSSE